MHVERETLPRVPLAQSATAGRWSLGSELIRVRSWGSAAIRERRCRRQVMPHVGAAASARVESATPEVFWSRRVAAYLVRRLQSDHQRSLM